MMVPSMRLMGFCALALLPAAWFLDHGPAAPWPALAVFLVSAATAAWDQAAGRRWIKTVVVHIAPVIRMTVGRPGQIDLTVRRSAARGGSLRLGLALPAAFASDQADLFIHSQAEQTACDVAWPCIALRRGRFLLDRCHVEHRSPLGLWDLRRRFTLACELRAYPNLTSGRHGLAGLFRQSEWGLNTQRRMGKGREFEQLRDYMPGDSFEDIDWKATARRRRPVTRVFQVEQAQEIYVVLDASRLSTRPAAYLIERRQGERIGHAAAQPAANPATIVDRYVTAALVMAVVAEQMADRYGLLIFSDQPDCFIRAGRGHAHYNACREALYDRRARLVSPDFDELFTFIGTHIRKRALFVFLTNLDDPMLAESFEQAISIAGRRHMVMVNTLRPPGAHPLFSNGDVKSPLGIYQHLAGHALWEALFETRRRLRRHGAGLELLEPSQLCSQLVGQYLDVKQRQVL